MRAVLHRRHGTPGVVAVALAAAAVLTATTGTAQGAEGTPVAGAEVLAPAGITSRGDEVILVSGEGGDVRSITGGEQQVIGSGLPRGRFTNGATGVAVDGAGNVYVGAADEGAVHVFGARGSSVHATGLGAPVGLAFSPAGDLHVADAGGRRVLRVSADGSIAQVGDTFEERPFGLAFGPSGDLFVSTQRDGKVFRIDRSGKRALFGSTGGSAEGLVADRSGGIYVGDGQEGVVHRIARADATPAPVLEGQNGPIWLGTSRDGGKLLVAVQNVRTGDGEPEGDVVLTLDAPQPAQPAARPQVMPRDVPLAAGTQAFVAGGESVRPSAPLPVSIRSDIGREAAEPTVAVTKAGNVFIPAATFDGPGVNGITRLARTEIRASYDRGKTWQTVGDGNEFANPPTTLDPFIFVDPDTDRIFNDDLTLACSYLSYSDDEGKTFTVNPAACGLPVNDHQSIATGKPVTSSPTGYPNIFYYCGINQIADTSCAKSTDGGRTFIPGGIAYVGINPGSENLFCGGLAGHVITGVKGEVYVPRLYCDVPTVAISTNEGTTFTQVKVSDVEGEDFQHESGIAIDSAGNAYYTWVGFDRLPRLAVSRDGGRTWEKEMVLTPPELAQGNLPAIAAFGPGQVAVSFYGSANRCCYEVDEQEPGDRDNSKARWSTYVVTSSNALAPEPTFYSTTVDPRTDPSVKRACGPGRCGNALDFLGVIVDSTGEVWSSSVDTCTPKPGDITGSNVEGDCVADPEVRQNNRRGIAAHFALPDAAAGIAYPIAAAGAPAAAPDAAAARPAGGRLPATGAGAVVPLVAILLAGAALVIARRRRGVHG